MTNVTITKKKSNKGVVGHGALKGVIWCFNLSFTLLVHNIIVWQTIAVKFLTHNFHNPDILATNGSTFAKKINCL